MKRYIKRQTFTYDTNGIPWLTDIQTNHWTCLFMTPKHAPNAVLQNMTPAAEVLAVGGHVALATNPIASHKFILLPNYKFIPASNIRCSKHF